jgi:hypothetical protein
MTRWKVLSIQGGFQQGVDALPLPGYVSLNYARVATNTVFIESFELPRKQCVLGDLAATLLCQMS